MKCDNLLRDANEQYKRIIDALEEFKRGQISSNELNAAALGALDRVDESIKEYEKQ
jgi:hypothetical protein